MIRDTFVMRNGRLVKKRSAQSVSAGPMTISDDLKADLEHMDYGDGRRTASKSEYRRWTKEAGSHEKGNDRQRPAPRALENIGSDVAQAVQMLKQGYRPQYRNIEGD